MQPQDGGVERDVCDKLLMLCDMFGVTLDDLVMGDVCASAGRGGAGRVGCVDAGRMDLAADTAGGGGGGGGGGGPLGFGCRYGWCGSVGWGG